MILPDFTYHRAKSLAEALKLLADHENEAKILAGGTDLLLQMKRGTFGAGLAPTT